MPACRLLLPMSLELCDERRTAGRVIFVRKTETVCAQD